MKGKFKLKRDKKSDDKQETLQQSENVSTSYSDEEVKAELDELAATPVKQRIWEVDFVRGLMILFVVWDHFMWDVSNFGRPPYNTGLFTWLYQLTQSYYSGVLRKVTHDVFVTMFVFTSGVSCSFSRNNGKRALKMIAFSCLLTAATYALSAIVGDNLTIHFNVIHVISLSVLLWAIIEYCWDKCAKNWQKNIFGVVMLVVVLVSLIVGACAKAQPWTSENYTWFFLTEHKLTGNSAYSKFCGGDYLPFLPDFGWFLVGALLGRVIYKERKSIFPSVNPKYVCPITFCGKYSLWVYLGSQIAMYGLMYLLAGVLGWL